MASPLGANKGNNPIARGRDRPQPANMRSPPSVMSWMHGGA
jgi:hypothetical protein